MKRREYRPLSMPDALPVRLEELLSNTLENNSNVSTDDMRKLAHELKACQIELQMQKDELRRVRNQLQTVIHKNQELIDSIPPSRCIITDVIQTRTENNSLKLSEEIYKRIVETTDEGIWINDPHGKTLFVNQKMAEMLGYSREEMIGEVGLEILKIGHNERE